MTQRLSELLREQCFLGNAVSPLKTKRGVRSKAMKKAWATRKRFKTSRSRTMTAPASTQDTHLT